MHATWKKILFIVVLLAIVGTIIYLESIKAPHEQAVTVIQSIENASSSGTMGTSTAMTGGGASSSESMGGAMGGGLTPAQFLASRASIVAQEETEYQAAPEITDPTGFVNTPPFQLSDYVGKDVVLLDFWTYSCINCIRTIPYLNAWYQKYNDQGLVIVGIQTPEFEFEHDINNVEAAVQKFGIQYPVVLDNNMGTWDAYGNLYWPHEYLINIDGFIVHDHIGEGDYDTTETAIQQALIQRDEALGISTSTLPTTLVTPSDTISIDYNDVQSPETYFGTERNEYLANGAQGQAGLQTLTIPASTQPNELYLGGTWNFADQYATNQNAGAEIKFEYDAKNVYMVASANTPVTIKVLRDGQPLGSFAGADVSATSSTAVVQADRLYNLISGSDYGDHTIDIVVQNPGLNAYTFTFG
jgi:thiol-disulfide isomerase/thioredoxin